MHRIRIGLQHSPHEIRMRTATALPEASTAERRSPQPAASVTETTSSQESEPATPPPAPAADAALEKVSQLLERLASTVDEFEQRRRQSLDELQVAAVELAVAAAAHVVRESIDRGDFGIEARVAELVEQLGLNQPIVVRLHPADVQLLQQRIGDVAPPWDGSRLTFVPDPQLSRGDLRAESDGQGLIRELGPQLLEIRRQWLESLDDAQTERRRPERADSRVRRYPDRRETA